MRIHVHQTQVAATNRILEGSEGAGEGSNFPSRSPGRAWSFLVFGKASTSKAASFLCKACVASFCQAGWNISPDDC